MKATDVEFNLNNDSSFLYKNSTCGFYCISQSENKKIRQRDKRLHSVINSTFKHSSICRILPDALLVT